MEYDNIYFYDIEAFSTFMCLSFLDDKTGEITQFKLGCDYNDLKKIKEFVNRNILLVGYNNQSYDDAVLRYLLSRNDARNITKNSFELSKRLIDFNSRRDDDILALRYPRNIHYFWNSLDLMKIMAFDRMGVSLKQIAINLKHELIQDLPYDFEFEISTEEVPTVLSYNANDSTITRKLYYKILPQIELRKEIGKLYDVDVMNASDSKMGNIILEHFYKTELNADVRALRDLRTKRREVNLGECIPPVIEFHSPELIALYNKIKNTTVYAYNEFKFEEKISFKGTSYSIGSGGIHSMESACRFDSDSTKKILSCDIGSMYPTCIIINNIYPEHLGEDFVKVLSMLTAERLASKKKNKVKSEALKISVNGLYGKLNSDTFWLEDAKAMLRVTIACQLYLLMLVEMLESENIHCVSANTDGIECNVPVELEKTYYATCKKWMEKTGFILEYTEYKSYIKRDVNNYIAIGIDGKLKRKGAFLEEIDLKKGYKHPVIPKAVNQYFVNKIPVEKTIRECRDILDFCISQKTGADFQMEHHTLQGIKYLQKTNRFYISNSGGTLQKRRKSNGKMIGLFVKRNVKILNVYNPETPFSDYDVNIDWYIKEANSLIKEIEPKVVQEQMFSNITDYGAKTKLFVPSSPSSEEKAKLKIVKEKDIREANKTRTTFNVSPRLVLVTGIDTKYSPTIQIYSLLKGENNSIKINKDLFELIPIKLGDVIRMESFIKKPKFMKKDDEYVEVEGEFVYWLDDYSIVSDFSEFKWKS